MTTQFAIPKNPTPRQIAVFSALIITTVVGLIFLLISVSGLLDRSVLYSVLLVGLVFVVSYFVIIYYLRRYIYRKIKLIYKTIHQQKLTSREKSRAVDMDVDIMDQMEREVAEWADDQAKEIANLKEWQSYRRKFLGDISHELKTPIFSIQGYLETLLDGGYDDPAVRVKYLERAATNVERLNTIVEDLHSISKLESGTMVLEEQVFDIRELTEEVFADLEYAAGRNRVELTFKPGAEQPYRVRADRETIRQVLMNLVTNSIKYGRETNGATKVAFYDMDRRILIEVADNGLGIPERHLNHVFDRFYRVDKSRSRDQGGSGLGLSIVKHIVEAHKQTINVRSSDGLGSTFGFTLEKA